MLDGIVYQCQNKNINREENTMKKYCEIDTTFVHRILTQEEEINFGKTIRNSDPLSNEYKEAFNTLLECNLRLVAKEAQNFYKKSSGELHDLVGEGYLGLVHAIEMYDPEKSNNARFATYATYWIQQKIRLYITKINVAHIPNYLVQDISKYRKVIGENPNNNFSREELKGILKFDEKQLILVEQANVKSVSINQSVAKTNNGGTTREVTLLDILADGSKTPDEMANQKYKFDFINETIKVLTPIEKEIIYGQFYSDDEISLKDIGKKYGFTYERIRQIKNKVLLNLKSKFKKYDIISE